jgi:hypothetical protein
MKINTLCVVLIGCLIAGVTGADTGPAGAPSAFLPEVQHEFEPVPEGTEILYPVKLKNTGTAVLKVERVKTG